MTSREHVAAPSSAYNLRFGAGDAVRSGPNTFNPIFSSQRNSLPPVQEPQQQRGGSRHAPFMHHQPAPPNKQVEHLLHQLRTPTNPKVNIKFARALQECSTTRSNEKQKEADAEKKKAATGQGQIMNDKFEEIFGLIARDAATHGRLPPYGGKTPAPRAHATDFMRRNPFHQVPPLNLPSKQRNKAESIVTTPTKEGDEAKHLNQLVADIDTTKKAKKLSQEREPAERVATSRTRAAKSKRAEYASPDGIPMPTVKQVYVPRRAVDAKPPWRSKGPGSSSIADSIENSLQTGRNANVKPGLEPTAQTTVSTKLGRAGANARASRDQNTAQSTDNKSSLEAGAMIIDVDSRDERFFNVAPKDLFSKTAEAFAPSTVFNASRFPEEYQVEGLAEGKVLPPPPKSSLRHRRMTYDAHSERNIRMFHRAQDFKITQERKFKSRNKPFDLNISHIPAKMKTRSILEEDEGSFDNDLLRRSLNLSPMSCAKLIDQMQQIRNIETVSKIKRRLGMQGGSLMTEADARSLEDQLRINQVQLTFEQQNALLENSLMVNATSAAENTGAFATVASSSMNPLRTPHVATLGDLPPLNQQADGSQPTPATRLNQTSNIGNKIMSFRDLSGSAEQSRSGNKTSIVHQSPPHIQTNLVQVSEKDNTIGSVEFIQNSVMTQQPRVDQNLPTPTIVRQRIPSKMAESYHQNEPQGKVFHLNEEGDLASSAENLSPGSKLVKVRAQPPSELRHAGSTTAPTDGLSRVDVDFNPNDTASKKTQRSPRGNFSQSPKKKQTQQKNQLDVSKTPTALQTMLADAKRKDHLQKNRDNFYWQIENNPGMSIKDGLDLASQIRTLEKQVRSKQTALQRLRAEQLQSLIDGNELAQQRLKLRDAYIRQMAARAVASQNRQHIEGRLELVNETPDDSIDSISLGLLPEHHTTHARAGVLQVKPLDLGKLETTPTEAQKSRANSTRLNNAHMLPSTNPASLASQTARDKSTVGAKTSTADRSMPVPVVKPQTQNSNSKHKQSTTLSTEYRMNNFYKMTVANEFKRSKHQLNGCLDTVKNQLDLEQREIMLLKQENEGLRHVMRRYQKFIEQFESTWDPKYLQKTRARKQAEHRQHKAQISPPTAKSAEKKKEYGGPLVDREKLLQKRTTIGSLTGEYVEIGTIEGTRSPDLNIVVDPLVRDSETQEVPSPVGRRNAVESVASRPRIMMAGESIAKNMLPKDQSQQKSSVSGLMTDSKFVAGEKIDSELVAKLSFQVKQACRQEKCLSLCLSLFDILKVFLNCQKLMIVPIDSFMHQVVTRKDLNSLEVLQFVREFEYRDDITGITKKLVGIAKTAGDMCPDLILPSISDFENCPEIVVKDNKLAILIHHNKEGTPLMCIQVEYDPKKVGTESQKGVAALKHSFSIVPGVPSEVKYFKRVEAQIILLIFQGVQMKLEKILFKQKNRDERFAQLESIKLVERSLEMHTIKALARHINNSTPEYFGYDVFNVMFHDKEAGQLYTVTFGDEEERKQLVQEKIKKAKSEREKLRIRDKEYLTDYVIRIENMIQYPVHAGLTSKVYNTCKSIMYNNFTPSMDYDFVNEIDNPRSIKTIDNLILAAMTRENGTCNGILQMFNKGSAISEYDRKRLEALGKLFGGCLEKLEDKMKSLTRNLAVILQGEEPIEKTRTTYNWILAEGPANVLENILKGIYEMEAELRNNNLMQNSSESSIQ